MMIGTRLLGYNLRQSDLRSRIQKHADRDHANWLVATGAFPNPHGDDCTHATDGPDYIDTDDVGVDSLLDLLGLFPPRR